MGLLTKSRDQDDDKELNNIYGVVKHIIITYGYATILSLTPDDYVEPYKSKIYFIKNTMFFFQLINDRLILNNDKNKDYLIEYK
jgi:hypothetical protein